VKRRRWCSDIDDGCGDRQGVGTAVFVVVWQQLAGRGLAALAVVLVTSRRQRQCWQWVWRAAIGTREALAILIIVQKIVLWGALFLLPGALFLLLGALFSVRPLLQSVL
jgi:hypothetical protein